MSFSETEEYSQKDAIGLSLSQSQSDCDSQIDSDYNPEEEGISSSADSQVSQEFFL